ncbi:hypothetical protein BgiMline_031378 [Biomphalaria glabrata]|nr:hypothetical protein BgiMline_019615 [Biomphalaria glabrata]
MCNTFDRTSKVPDIKSFTFSNDNKYLRCSSAFNTRSKFLYTSEVFIVLFTTKFALVFCPEESRSFKCSCRDAFRIQAS